MCERIIRAPLCLYSLRFAIGPAAMSETTIEQTTDFASLGLPGPLLAVLAEVGDTAVADPGAGHPAAASAAVI